MVEPSATNREQRQAAFSTAGRRSIRLYEDNIPAAAQILAWIALPHRPEHGVGLLCHWYWQRRRFRGDTVPEIPFPLKKPVRIQSQLPKFRQYCLNAFRAGIWFNYKVLSSETDSWFADFELTTSDLALRSANAQGHEISNEFRDIWSKRKPIAHMALAAGNAIAAHHRQFDLERAVFDPVWVPEAIEGAEEWARSGVVSGAFEPALLHRFHRDTF